MSRAVVLGAVAAVGAVPLTVALSDAHLRDAPLLMVVSTATAALAAAALALQPWLAALGPRAARLRDHAVLGVVAVGLVLVHVGALVVAEPDDALFALSWNGPTRARMALLATLLLLAAAVLGILRRRLRWDAASWRILHGALAALAVALGVGHAVLTDGAMDEEGTAVLLTLGILGVGGVAARLRRTLRILRSPVRHAMIRQAFICWTHP